MLGLYRNQVYYIVSKGVFDIVQIGRYKCVTKDSFHRWYESQSHYKMVGKADIERKERVTMASIVKRKKKYSVVYTYIDESVAKSVRSGKPSIPALKRKKKNVKIEYEQETGSFIVPTAKIGKTISWKNICLSME